MWSSGGQQNVGIPDAYAFPVQQIPGRFLITALFLFVTVYRLNLGVSYTADVAGQAVTQPQGALGMAGYAREGPYETGPEFAGQPDPQSAAAAAAAAGLSISDWMRAYPEVRFSIFCAFACLVNSLL